MPWSSHNFTIVHADTFYWWWKLPASFKLPWQRGYLECDDKNVCKLLLCDILDSLWKSSSFFMLSLCYCCGGWCMHTHFKVKSRFHEPIFCGISYFKFREYSGFRILKMNPKDRDYYLKVKAGKWFGFFYFPHHKKNVSSTTKPYSIEMTKKNSCKW